MTEEEIMLLAKTQVGITPQLLKLSEEANELGASILRFLNQAPWSRPEETLFMEMLEELMDVDLMVQQVKTYLDMDVLNIIRRKKLDRYESRVLSLDKNYESPITSYNDSKLAVLHNSTNKRV
jgi:hypothetical protein